jgi:hypothetical protein
LVTTTLKHGQVGVAIDLSLPVCRRLEANKPVLREPLSYYAIWSNGARLADGFQLANGDNN